MDHGAGQGAATDEMRGTTVGNDNLPAVSTQAGRAAAESGVARARDAYERFAEAGEMALNAFETSMAQTFEGWRSVMGSSRETAHQLTDSNVAGARRMREQWDAAGARLYNAFEDNASHAMAAMREIGHRVLIAADTNIRANLDFAERVAKATDAREAATLNLAFLQEQSRRLTEQMVDLHQTTSRLAREAAARNEKP
ncbi:phasin family protein [Methylobacterium mesophilicum]|uniref:phasin family protein n=1 Tax=Methylobacterium mesophilicum TaxID=39956 RepID=UPI0002C606D7|nr:phasin family protein [Methylobacterium mesophilicum]